VVSDVHKGIIAELMPESEAWLQSVSVTPDGRYALTAFKFGQIEVWDLTHFSRKARWATERRLLAGAMTKDGRRAILSKVGDLGGGQVDLIDLATGESLAGWDPQDWLIHPLAVSVDGDSVIGCVSDFVVLWKLASGIPGTWQVQGEGVENPTAVCADAGRIVVGLADGLIKILDLPRLAKMSISQASRVDFRRVHELHDEDLIIDTLYYDGGQRAFTLHSSGAVKAWNLTKPIPFKTLIDPGDPQGYYASNAGLIEKPDGSRFLHPCKLAASPDNVYVAAGYFTLDLGLVKVWDSHKAELMKVLRGHTNQISIIQFDPSRQRVVSGSLDDTVRVWDLYTGALVHTLYKHTDYIFALQFLLPMRS
jgi:WD40 repeat protein